MTQDEKYMKEAIRQAKKAYALDEVPIGCVIVQNGKIIARGYNRRNTDKNNRKIKRILENNMSLIQVNKGTSEFQYPKRPLPHSVQELSSDSR